jgi:hypothetical protein
MPDYTTTANMGLVLPTVLVRPGSTYATDWNANGTTIDTHDHTEDKGVPIPAAGLAIDGNVSWGGFSITALKSTVYTQQASVATANAQWFKTTTGDYWVTNGDGTQIQITSGGGLNTAALITDVWSQLAVATNYVILAEDAYTHFKVSTAAARTITLPLAAAVTAGRFYVISDVTGSGASNNITINRAGSDTIHGDASYVIETAYGTVTLVSDGTSKWQIAGGTVADRVIGGRLSFYGDDIFPALIDVADGTTGGSIIINAGVGTAGSGGGVGLTGGASTGSNGTGGAIALTCGAGHGSGTGGAVTITAGAGGSTGDGGAVSIYGGASEAGTGGHLTIASGDGAGTGGDVTITAGAGAGGIGLVTIAGGDATATNGNGGEVRIAGGVPDGSGLSGKMSLRLDGEFGSTLVSLVEVAAGRRVLGLCIDVTSVQMPASTGDMVIFVANASTVPTANASGGGILYCEGGALKFRGTSGTITTVGPA